MTTAERRIGGSGSYFTTTPALIPHQTRHPPQIDRGAACKTDTTDSWSAAGLGGVELLVRVPELADGVRNRLIIGSRPTRRAHTSNLIK